MITLSDQHLNIIMELLSNAPFKVSAPIIQEIVKQVQAAQGSGVPPQPATEVRVGGNGGGQ